MGSGHIYFMAFSEDVSWSGRDRYHQMSLMAVWKCMLMFL